LDQLHSVAGEADRGACHWHCEELAKRFSRQRPLAPMLAPEIAHMLSEREANKRPSPEAPEHAGATRGRSVEAGALALLTRADWGAKGSGAPVAGAGSGPLVSGRPGPALGLSCLRGASVHVGRARRQRVPTLSSSIASSCASRDRTRAWNARSCRAPSRPPQATATAQPRRTVPAA
jgi:hypothetical protein